MYHVWLLSHKKNPGELTHTNTIRFNLHSKSILTFAKIVIFSNLSIMSIDTDKFRSLYSKSQNAKQGMRFQTKPKI